MNIKHLLLTAAATALLGISAPALAHHDGHGDDDHGHAAHQHGKQDKIISRAKPKKRLGRVSAAKSPTSISNTTTAVRTMMSKSSKTDRNTKSLSMPVPAA